MVHILNCEYQKAWRKRNPTEYQRRNYKYVLRSQERTKTLFFYRPHPFFMRDSLGTFHKTIYSYFDLKIKYLTNI